MFCVTIQLLNIIIEIKLNLLIVEKHETITEVQNLKFKVQLFVAVSVCVCVL